MAETAAPDDAIFETFHSRVETERDSIELRLTPSLTQICKLDTLHLEAGSYLEGDLRPYYSDVLYSLDTTRGSGYVHVLIEHHSA
ncbi:Rpn family recombination-promoting nuclease/putative transposase, partial [Enterobacter hormaechei]|uniref:Rpn family recombination-promoting nuclease/putative transposase n=1 Tax=Enterobacter hormaechei TaxID=158836 RepID=UPI0033149774